MNTVKPPEGGYNAGPVQSAPAPMAVQQTTVIQVGSQKSVVGAVLLGFFFGPLGMLYATVPGAVIMFLINIPVVFLTFGLGLLITIPICAIWAGVAANSHNNRLQGGFSAQQAAMPAAAAAPATAPAGWHDDPEGSGRLRYYDGMRWTDRYAEQAGAPTPPPPAEAEQAPPQLEPPTEPVATDPESEAPTMVADAEPQRVFCGSCGNSLAATARFCSGCGEAQAVA